MNDPRQPDPTLEHPAAGRNETLDHRPSTVEPAGDRNATLDHPSTVDEIDSDGNGGRTIDHEASAAEKGGNAAPRKRSREIPKVPGYEILSELGRGGMGVVYKARQTRLNRLVALKMILAGGHASPQQRTRFDQEARSVARLQHPNIVQIYEIGEHDGLPYFSLEFVEGGTLDTLIDRHPQPPRTAAEIVETLARAMQFAHEQNIVHRDLKPANILLARAVSRGTGSMSLAPSSRSQISTSGTSLSDTASQGLLSPKITDFGLAKAVEEGGTNNTVSGTILGTPSYMAPEQARGEVAVLGPMCDLYSLGAILYELLTGRPPFQSASVLDTLDQVRNREPVPIHQLQPSVPPDVETICLKCLQKEPAKRYANCGELADDLARFIAGHPILARPISNPERIWRWCRRNPWVAGLSATAAALLLCIAFGSVVVAVQMSAKNKTIETEKEAAIKAKGEAQKNEQDAIAARISADENAREAASQAQVALGALQTLVKQVQERLDEVAGTQQLKEDLLKLALGEVNKVNKVAEKSTSIDATRMSALLQLGHLYKQLGKSDEAMAQFRQVYEIAKKRVILKKGTDVARFNLAVIVLQLADMDREVNRDMQAALAHEMEALTITQDIDEHPKTDENGEGAKDKASVKDSLAEMNRRVGVIHLRLGDIPRAAACFQKTLQHQRERYAAIENDPKIVPLEKLQQRLSLAISLLSVGDTAYRLGDAAKSAETLAESLAMYELMLKENAKTSLLKRGLAGACMLTGDFHLRTGDTAQASALYARARLLFTELAKADPKNSDYQWNLAIVHYRHGQLALRTKDASAAKSHFQACLTIRQQLADKDAVNERRKMELMLALAHVGEHAQAAKLASNLERTVKQDAEFLIDLARCFAQCATATSGDTELEQRYIRQAIQAIEKAVKQGYRDGVYLSTEVDLDPLRTQEAFRKILESIRRGTDSSAGEGK